MTPEVVHCKKYTGSFTYVGRPSKWGNPFTVKEHGHGVAIKMFYDWLHEPAQSKLLSEVTELTGRNLGCWCAPKRCHAQILLFLANGKDVEAYHYVHQTDNQQKLF